MELIVITPEENLANETEIVNRLFEAGLHRLHLRKPLLGLAYHRAYIDNVATEYHERIVIHNYFELMDEFGLGGLHLNSFARNDNAVWAAIKSISSVLISTSFHSWQEVISNEFHYGYVFISPVFDSISKDGYKAAIDLAGVGTTKAALKGSGKYCPAIIGLGGVGAEQIKTLQTYGFDGAAMLGAIWQAADPIAEFMKIININFIIPRYEGSKNVHK